MRRQEQSLKAARAEEVTDDNASLAARRKYFQSVNAAFRANRCVCGSKIARQQERSCRRSVVAQPDIEIELSQRRRAESHFTKLDSSRGAGTDESGIGLLEVELVR